MSVHLALKEGIKLYFQAETTRMRRKVTSIERKLPVYRKNDDFVKYWNLSSLCINYVFCSY